MAKHRKRAKDMGWAEYMFKFTIGLGAIVGAGYVLLWVISKLI